MARESDLEERQRQDKEKADAIRKRQIRLGHISVPEEEKKSAPKKAATRKKSA